MTTDELQIILKAKDEASAAIAKIGKVLTGVNKDVKDVSTSGKGLSTTFMEIVKGGMALMGIYQVMSLVRIAFSTAFNSVNQYKMGIASLAAVTMSFMKQQEGVDPGEMWKQAVEYAKQLYPALENISIASLMSGQQVNMMMIEFLKHGVALNTTIESQVEGFRNVANALFIATGGLMIERQIVTEINAFMQGQVRAVDRLGLLLGKIDKDFKRNIITAKEQGKVFEYLGEVLKSFQFAAKDFATVWMAVRTAIETVVNRTLRGGLIPAYEIIMKQIVEIVKWTNVNKDQLSTGIYRNWMLIKAVIDSAIISIKLWREVAGESSIIWYGIGKIFEGIAFFIVMLPGVLGTALEFIKAIKYALAGFADLLREEIFSILTKIGEKLEWLPGIGKKIKDALDFSSEIESADTRSRAFFARMTLDWNNMGTAMENAEENWYNFYRGIHTTIGGAAPPELVGGNLPPEQQTQAENALEALKKKTEEYRASLIELRDPLEADRLKLEEFIREKIKDLDLTKKNIEIISQLNSALGELKKSYTTYTIAKLTKKESETLLRATEDATIFEQEHLDIRLKNHDVYLNAWFERELETKVKIEMTTKEREATIANIENEYFQKRRELYDADIKYFTDEQQKKLDFLQSIQNEIRTLMGEENVDEKNRLNELMYNIDQYGYTWGMTGEQIDKAINTINSKIKELSMSPEMKEMISTAQDLFGSFRSVIEDSFTAIVMRTGEAKEAFRRFSQDIIKMIIQLALRLIWLKYIFKSLPEDIFGVSKYSLFGMPQTSMGTTPGTTGTTSGVPGISTGTSMGRGIPINAAGNGGGNTYVININAMDAESFIGFAQKNRRVFQEQMSRAMEKNTETRGAIRRYR